MCAAPGCWAFGGFFTAVPGLSKGERCVDALPLVKIDLGALAGYY